MKKFLLLVFFTSSLTACDKFVQDFVGKTDPSSETTGRNQIDGPQLSPGAAAMSGTLYRTEATMNTRQQLLLGSQVKALVNLDQSPVQ